MSKCFSYIYLFLFVIQVTNAQLSLDSLESVGLNSNYINAQVDSIMQHGITEEAFPGAQLLVAKNGKIIFHEAYGFHTYDNIIKVSKDDLYDLASVSKIVGPLPALMKLYEEGKLDLDRPFSEYWKPWGHKKDKRTITLRELLAHQSGMSPYIVFLEDVYRKNGSFKKRFIRSKKSKRFSNQVSENLYINPRFEKKIYRKISRSKVSDQKTYRYSGLASLIYPKLIENLTGQSYVSYLEDNFYKPLNCNTLGYLPLERDFKNRIVPTEMDSILRKGIVKAWVHDENAALFGGISGNAGLFGSAIDLAKYMQMLLQKGNYNGQQLLKPETIKLFTTIQYPENDNRRGLGFDKPLIGNDTLSIQKSYPAPQVSAESYGHAGFTGTFVWADPKNNLVFIFLSNRVYPNRSHRNIYNLNIRPRLQQVFYLDSNYTDN